MPKDPEISVYPILRKNLPTEINDFVNKNGKSRKKDIPKKNEKNGENCFSITSRNFWTVLSSENYK